ncbi:GNAT family N-acetyltransferase [Limimaricola hongkongensis]|uniref:Acetyltransferase, GNAT family protein n=1 Tax=Limimaricola hongkongensis DSM 17492 TaxID=1122180 RepID=A0A017HGD0_9RHOB|nr:GNAT family N-acetyltransferase [Limimaricola hongkongensis]EYD73375.1 acetyltransferase, GNAT family protein [Limimaricola hongkongensis DSM 17492]
MSVEIMAARATDPGPRALIEASQDLMRAMFRPDQNHFLPIEALDAPDIRFVVARDGAALLGCGALQVKSGYGELKSVFVRDAARGRGVGAALIGALETAARAEGLTLLRLETAEELAAACRLYARHGYARRGRFGDYVENGCSVFMEKRL